MLFKTMEHGKLPCEALDVRTNIGVLVTAASIIASAPTPCSHRIRNAGVDGVDFVLVGPELFRQRSNRNQSVPISVKRGG
jgi:hypothetical protein